MYPTLVPPFFLRILLQAGENGRSSPAPLELEPAFKRIMVYLFVGMRGGQNRARIVELLKKEPCNANKISETLGLDYKTVRHHLRLLEENGVIVASAHEAYGAVYFLTVYFEKYFFLIRRMWAGFGQS
jgi:DNA-binding transcriptional ArsR family regulator